MIETPKRILGPDGQPLTPANDGYGDFSLPPTFQYVAITQGGDKTYWMDRYDEAIRDSRDTAIAMTRDAFLMSLLNERARAIASRRWHIEVEDENDERQTLIKNVVTQAVRRTPGLYHLRFELVKWTVWYGRFGMQIKWKWDNITVKKPQNNPSINPSPADQFLESNPDAGAGPPIPQMVSRRALVIEKHSPVQGDKIGHQFDDTPFVLINSSYIDQLPAASIVLTTLGRAILLKGSWRQRFILHGYHREDEDFFRQFDQAEAIYGIGDRSVIYWLNYERLEMESWFSTYFERVGLGTSVYLYDGGNPNALQEAKLAAKQNSNKSTMFVPVWQDTQNRLKGAFERIETPTAGADALRAAIKHKEEKIERLIVGQASSSRSETSGMGTHNTDFQADTKADITRMDGEMYDDTFTRDVIRVIVQNTFPEWPDLWSCARHVTDLEAGDSDKKLEAVATAAGLGVSFRENEVRALTGLSDPVPGDAIIGGSQTLDMNDKGNRFGERPGEDEEDGGQNDGGNNGRDQNSDSRRGGNGKAKHSFARWDSACHEHKYGKWTADEVLKEVRRSPQFKDKEIDWKEYAEKFGIKGRFHEVVYSAEDLEKMIVSGKLHVEPVLNAAAVQAKARLHDYNKVMLAVDKAGNLRVVDGNHSLAAALRNREPKIECVVPDEDGSEEEIQFDRWITLGGHPSAESGAKHSGGFPVLIDDNGKILQGGPKNLTGANVSAVKSVLDQEDEKKKEAEHSESASNGLKSDATGKNQSARVRLMPDADPEEMNNAIRDVFGEEPSDDFLPRFASMTGAPEGSQVRVGFRKRHVSAGHSSKSEYVIVINVEHEQFDSPAVREMAVDENGEIYIENQSFFLQKKFQKSGLGAKIFADQVAGARENGVSYIQCDAAHGDNMNGYYTWPRLGYDYPLHYLARSIPKTVTRLKEIVPGAKTLLDVMANTQGREFWKLNGASLTGARFDLNENSRSLRVLNDYLEAKRMLADG